VRYYEVGYYSVLLLIFLGEVTNPLQNVVNVCTQGLKGGKVSWAGGAKEGGSQATARLIPNTLLAAGLA